MHLPVPFLAGFPLSLRSRQSASFRPLFPSPSQLSQTNISGSLNQLGSRANHVMFKRALGDEYDALLCLKLICGTYYKQCDPRFDLELI